MAQHEQDEPQPQDLQDAAPTTPTEQRTYATWQEALADADVDELLADERVMRHLEQRVDRQLERERQVTPEARALTAQLTAQVQRYAEENFDKDVIAKFANKTYDGDFQAGAASYIRDLERETQRREAERSRGGNRESGRPSRTCATEEELGRAIERGEKVDVATWYAANAAKVRPPSRYR